MGIVVGLFVVLHLLGLSAILGGWIATRLGAERGRSVLAWGARAQLLIGVVLVGLLEMAGRDVNYAKIATKIVVSLAVVACAEIAAARARRGSGQPALLDAAAALTVANVLVAVLWRSGE